MLLRLKHEILGTPLEAPARYFSSRLMPALHALSNPATVALHRENDAMFRIMRALLTPQSNCIDAGAHIGFFLSIFHSLAPEGAHLAIEPSVTKSAWLRRKFPHATIFEGALADESGEALYYENAVTSALSGLTPAAAANGAGYQVKVATLDSLTANHPPTDFIKLDVEGFELPALRGARDTIERSRPHIIFECGACRRDTPAAEDQGQILHKMLTEEHGYSIHGVCDYLDGDSPLTREQFRLYRLYPFRALNFLATPPA